MSDEQKNQQDKPATKSAPIWVLFVLPTILALIGVYFVVTRPAPSARQAEINRAAGVTNNGPPALRLGGASATPEAAPENR